MSMRKIEYIEKRTDKHGVERVYGYTADGKCYFLNFQEVVRQYEARGIKCFEEVV